MSRSHQYSSYPELNAAIAVGKCVAKTVTKANTDQGMVLDHRVQRTGEAIVILASYIAYRMDMMNDLLEGEVASAFVNKLRNRSNGVVRACADFTRTIEPYIQGEEKKKAYSYFSEIITQCLDSLFEDIHRDEPEATYNVRRRAKLRYHDPYPTDVKERTAAFEDGYCKGYTDAMDDVMREVAELSDDNDTMLSVTIGDDGKINIRKL
jgi:hypothetical protein